MNNHEQILNLFDEYFKNTPKAIIDSDVDIINKLGTENGVTFEEYVSVLNDVTTFSLKDTGICDDIAFSDLYNNLINLVDMGKNEVVITQPKPIKGLDNTYTDSIESSFYLAA